MVHSPMRYAAAAVTITTVAFALVVVELMIIPTAVVAFTTPPRTSAFRSSIIHTYQHHRHPLNNVLPLLKRRGAIIKYSNSRAVNSEDDAFRKRTKLTAAAASSNSGNNKEGSEEKEEEGIRLNKVFKATHSRRSADKLIEEGRVTINGCRVHDKGGYKVIPYRDVITLDGKVVTGWEQINAIAPTNNKNHRQQKQQRNDDQQQQQHEEDDNHSLQTSSFEYVKYYKPLGVTCTTDLRIKDNIIHSIQSYGYNSRHRVYPIGRLDKETSGLIVLTSDGRIVNSVLRGERKQPKVYKVKVDGLLDDTHLQRLRVSCSPVFIYLLLLDLSFVHHELIPMAFPIFFVRSPTVSPTYTT